MAQPIRRAFALLIAGLLLLPTFCFAQTGRVFVSAEAYVGLARVVHVGTIVGLKPIEYAKPLTDTQKIGKPYRLAFEVSETIRGDAVKRFELVLSLQTTHFLECMRERSAPVMLVGGPNRIDSYPMPEIGIEEQGGRVDGQWYQFRLLEPVKVPGAGDAAEIAKQLNTYYDECRMFTNGLDVVQGREAILERARAFAKEHPKLLPAVLLRVPNAFGARCGSPNAYCAVKLPVCPGTRRTLLALKADPGIVLRPARPGGGDGDGPGIPAAEAEAGRASVRAATDKALAEFDAVDGR